MKNKIVLAVLFATSLAWAGEKHRNERMYEASFDKTWAACLQAASKYPILLADKADGLLTLELYPAAVNVGDFNHPAVIVGVKVTTVGTSTDVTLNSRWKEASAKGPAFLKEVDSNLK